MVSPSILHDGITLDLTGLSKTLIIGDIHVSDRISARHVDYFRDCKFFLEKVTQLIIEHEITVLILTGDLIGRTNEKNLASREALTYLAVTFQKWNELTNGNVFVVRGNHDISGRMTDFDVFSHLRLFKMASYVDVQGTRFHLVNYGEHERPLEMSDDLTNVVVGHSEFHIDGKTDWFFRSREAVDVASLSNFEGVEMIIGGHIHTPSPRIVSTSINGKQIQLFYLGCGTRPAYDKNIWETSFAMLVKSDEVMTDFDQINIDLLPIEDTFVKTIVDEEVKETYEDVLSEEEQFSIDNLREVLSTLNTYNLMDNVNYKERIEHFGRLDADATKTALHYIELAEEM